MSDVTRILTQIEAGDPAAAEQLLPLVYGELRKLAAAKLAHEKPGQTLQATALVHEAYLRLVGGQEPGARDQGSGDMGQEPVKWDGRGHFFAAAAEAMRRILVDQARSKQALKRGGELERREFEGLDVAIPEIPEDVVALDAALNKLAEADPRAAELVQLRFFAGLPLPEVAQLLGISPRTADRQWAYARAWLHQEIHGGSANADIS
jgi:RNA polymerase sigma factor (sigma-70 family)